MVWAAAGFIHTPNSVSLKPAAAHCVSVSFHWHMGISWLRWTILPESYLLNLSQIGGSVRYGLDKYRRMIGDVLLPDGTILNKELVKAGLAWWYCKYSVDQSLAELEIEAREAKRGLWQDPKPVPPWEWRKGLLPKGKS
jgi:hypothetical protein